MLLILVMKVSDFMEIANGARMNRIVELLYYTSAPHGMKSKVKVKDHFLKEVQAGALRKALRSLTEVRRAAQMIARVSQATDLGPDEG